MPRSRSRSRSNRRRENNGDDRKKHDDRRGEPKREGVAEAAKSGGSEQEIVSVAMRQLPEEIRERLEKLFQEGLLKEGDLDLRSITVFASLNEGLQGRVMNHLEGERIYVANARSKSGFLIATCDKAKTGCLDARGLGAIDPWRTALVAMATPKQKMIDLQPERDWLEQQGEDEPIKIQVNLGSDVKGELGVATVTVELPLTETAAAVKAKLVAMGVRSIPANKMKLHTEAVGYLKERLSFAFYNLSDGVVCSLHERKRAGTRFRADHTVMPKRPRTQTTPSRTSLTLDALKDIVGGGAELPGAKGLPKLPKLPSLPLLGAALPGLPELPALGGTQGSPRPPTLGTLPMLPGLPGLLPLPKLPACGAEGGLPAMPKIGGCGAEGLGAGSAGLGGMLSGTLPGGLPGADAKAGPKTSGNLLGGLGSLPMPNLDRAKALPGVPPPGADPKAAATVGGILGPPLSSPGMVGTMPKACGRMPDMGGPPLVKAQMPSGSGCMGTPMPKMPLPDVPPASSAAPPMGATPKGASPA